MKKQWNIPDEFKDIILERLTKIVSEGDDDEIALKAIAEVRHMNSQNQKDQHKVLDVSLQFNHARLSQVASELGIDESVIIEAHARSGGNLTSDGQESDGSG